MMKNRTTYKEFVKSIDEESRKDIQKIEDKVDMCEAVKAIKLEGKLEGRLEGIEALITTLRELGHDEGIVLEKIMEKFSVTEEEAQSYMQK